MIAASALPAAPGKGRLITLWILFDLVALVAIRVGGAKLAGAAAVMVALVAKVGLGQWFRHFTGLREVAAGTGVLTSRDALDAAVLLVTVMVGAIIAHVTVPVSSHAAPVVLFVLVGIIAYVRTPQNIKQQRTRT